MQKLCQVLDRDFFFVQGLSKEKGAASTNKNNDNSLNNIRIVHN